MSLSAMPVNPFVLNLAHSQEFMNSLALNLSQNKDFVCSLAQNKDFVCSLGQNKDFIKSLKCNIITLMDTDKEFKDLLSGFINCTITVSDQEILPRLTEVRVLAGLESFEDIEHEPTLPEQISLLSEKLEALSEPSRTHIESTASNIGITPETTLDLKACAIVEHLKEAVKPNEFGEYMITKKILNEFMTEKISLELRVKEVTRQTKKEIFKRAIKLFPDIVCIKTSKSGNKTKYLTLKSSLKRTDTTACTRLTGLGIWA
jgi:hypothetical protein